MSADQKKNVQGLRQRTFFMNFFASKYQILWILKESEYLVILMIDRGLARFLFIER